MKPEVAARTIQSSTAPWAPARAQTRLAQLETHLEALGIDDITTVVTQTYRDHELRARRGVMLSAATNLMSPMVAALHRTSLSSRPSMGWPGDKEQTAVQEIEHLEVLATTQVSKAMRAQYAEVRYPSATIANLAAYVAFTEPGDTIAVLSPQAGGHNSHQAGVGAAAIRGLRVAHLPYSATDLDVEASALPNFVEAVRPRLIVIGGSVTLFPHDLAPLRAAADRVGAVLMYDASHTAGLIAAGCFQDPLDEGADIMTFSTYKTFAGPAGGAAVTRSAEHARLLSAAAYPTLSSNYDPSRLAPLAMAAAEAAAQQPAWATPTIDCATELAARLHSRGHAVVGARQGFTRSHQVVIDATDLGDATTVVRQLETAGIYAGACLLPWQHPGAPAGIRFGLQEFVRSGGTLATVPLLAEAIGRALTGTPPDELRRTTAELLEHLSTDLWGRRIAPAS